MKIFLADVSKTGEVVRLLSSGTHQIAILNQEFTMATTLTPYLSFNGTTREAWAVNGAPIEFGT